MKIAEDTNTKSTTPRNQRKAPPRAAEAHTQSEAGKAAAEETSESDDEDGEVVEMRNGQRVGEDGKTSAERQAERQANLRKMPKAKQHAVKLRQLPKRFVRPEKWISELSVDAKEKANATELLNDIAACKKLIASICDRLEALPDDIDPPKAKGGGKAADKVGVGSKVVIRADEKVQKVYAGRVSPDDVMEIVAYRSGYAEVKHPSGIAMFLPRKHLQLAPYGDEEAAAE